MGRNNKHKRGARNKRGPVRSERRPSLTGRVQLHEHTGRPIRDDPLKGMNSGHAYTRR